MPFTPFHFGPGLFGKSVLSRYFSWTAFITSQVIIDFETLYYMLQRAYPIHRFFHTFVGATLAGLACGFLLIGVKRVIEANSPEFARFVGNLRPSFRSEFTSLGLMVGALVGGVSHPFLDGIMHRDIRPFLPWSESNPLLRLVGVGALHLWCLFVGFVGLAIMAFRVYRESLANKALQPTRSTVGQ